MHCTKTDYPLKRIALSLGLAFLSNLPLTARSQTVTSPILTTGNPVNNTLAAGATYSVGGTWDVNGNSSSVLNFALNATLTSGGSWGAQYQKMSDVYGTGNSTFPNAALSALGAPKQIEAFDLNGAPFGKDRPYGTPVSGNVTFQFSQAVPQNTTILLGDLGCYENSFVGPFTYTFKAFLNGSVVDTSGWTANVDKTYNVGTTPFTINTAAGTIVAGNYSASAYPEEFVALTPNTAFDRFEFTSASLEIDSWQVAFSHPVSSVPEPGSMALLAGVSLVVGAFARRRVCHC